MPDACLFCSGRANSKEDIFSVWMTREFTEVEGGFMPVTRTVSQQPPRTWENWTIAFSKIKAVCRECNSGWMSELEVQVRPLLSQMVRGQEIQLSESDQLDIATWATLKAYVFDSAAEFPSAVTRDECQLLRGQLRPPGNVRVFLAAYESGNQFAVTRIYATGPIGDDPRGHTAHATTFVIGHVVIQVLGNPRSQYRPYELPGIAHTHSQTINPPVIGGSSWPPRSLLTDVQLDEFVRMNLVAPMFVDISDPGDPRLRGSF
jgi:hypothetical protein